MGIKTNRMAMEQNQTNGDWEAGEGELFRYRKVY